MHVKAGFQVRSIHADMPLSKRNDVADEWNRPANPVDIMVLNSSISSTGLNLHHQCHYGIGPSFV